MFCLKHVTKKKQNVLTHLGYLHPRCEVSIEVCGRLLIRNLKDDDLVERGQHIPEYRCSGNKRTDGMESYVLIDTDSDAI